jgi:predicted nucleic acid-binding protein
MLVYVLSSAVVKRYLNEIGTAWITSLLSPAEANELHLVRIAGAEVTAAISRRSRGGGLAPGQAAIVLARFRIEFASLFRIVEVSPALIQSAMDLAERHGLRGYDAVQLAGALEVAAGGVTIGTPTTLVSSDVELNSAALTEGLQVEDPNAHP